MTMRKSGRVKKFGFRRLGRGGRHRRTLHGGVRFGCMRPDRGTDKLYRLMLIWIIFRYFTDCPFIVAGWYFQF